MSPDPLTAPVLLMAPKVHATPSADFENECKQLIRALAGRTQLEKRQIRETYKAMYGEVLVDGLANKDGSSMVEALYLWMLEPHKREAILARNALQQGRANYRALVEIFVGRKSSQIFLITRAYETRFKSKLDQDLLAIDPPHSYQRVSSLTQNSERGKLSDPFYRLEHQEKDMQKKKEAEPVLVRLQRVSDSRHADDYALNKALRAQLRDQKKRVSQEESASRKKGLSIRMLPDN